MIWDSIASCATLQTVMDCYEIMNGNDIATVIIDMKSIMNTNSWLAGYTKQSCIVAIMECILYMSYFTQSEIRVLPTKQRYYFNTKDSRNLVLASHVIDKLGYLRNVVKLSSIIHPKIIPKGEFEMSINGDLLSFTIR